ncbi:MAG: hypothetical protein QOE07_1693, partial [Acidimicrobiaceae bacterium]|nr:hypothetical protein [Acidimicrobiaceae bacterium]
GQHRGGAVESAHIFVTDENVDVGPHDTLLVADAALEGGIVGAHGVEEIGDGRAVAQVESMRRVPAAQLPEGGRHS